MLHELFVQAQLPVGRLDDRELIFVVVDGEVARESGTDRGERIAIAPQQPHAKGVERGNIRRRGEFGPFEQRRHAVPHLVRGLVGERDRQNRRWRHMVIANDAGDAVRDDAGFAAAGAGQNQQRTFGMRNGFALLGIEALEKIHAQWGVYTSS